MAHGPKLTPSHLILLIRLLLGGWQRSIFPHLVLAGSLDHPEVLRAADLLANRIKGAKKIILSDSAHVPNMEKPAEFNRIVLDFLSYKAKKQV